MRQQNLLPSLLPHPQLRQRPRRLRPARSAAALLFCLLLSFCLSGCGILFPTPNPGPGPGPGPGPAPDVDTAQIRKGAATAAETLPREIQLRFYGINMAMAELVSTTPDAIKTSREVLNVMETALKAQGHIPGQHPIWAAEITRGTEATKVGDKNLTDNMPLSECRNQLTSYLRFVALGVRDAIERGRHAP